MTVFRNLKYRYEVFRLGMRRRRIMRLAAKAANNMQMLRLMGRDISGMPEVLADAKKVIVMLDLEINVRRIAIRSNLPMKDAEFFNRQVVFQRLGYVPHQEIKIN